MFIVTAAWKEPVPGWTVSKNGPQGFLMGAAKGVVRRLPVAKELIYDYIPVDVVTNNIITAAYSVDRDGYSKILLLLLTQPVQDNNKIYLYYRGKELKVYHCTSSTVNPFRWSFIEHKINHYLHSYPLLSAVWYPHIKLVTTIFWFRLSAFFVHMIPAYILDTVTILTGGRPM